MKLFIPSTGAINRLHTHKVFPESVEMYGVFHNVEQAANWINVVDWEAQNHVLISDAKDMLGQRKFIQEQVKEGEWYLSADDNIRAFIDQDGNTLSKDRAWAVINESINEAEKRGAKLVGFATVDNPFFRKTKYRDVGFVVGKMFAEKRTAELECSGKVKVMDDYERTAQHLFRFGKVLINNNLHSKAKHYEKGGLGEWDVRLPQKLLDCEVLVRDWHGLYRFKAKAGKHPKSEIQMRFTSKEQVEAWRMDMLKWGKRGA